MLFFITAAVLLASAEAKFFKDCGSKLATVHNVTVSGCEESSSHCILKRNTDATIGLQFTPLHNIDRINTEVHGVIMNIPIPFPLPESDACKDNGLTCPLKEGTLADYKATLPILKSYPKVTVEVKWELQSEHGDLVCVLINAKLV
ncbi:ecdysteroid-regulated 16 kDa protein-like [Bombyx mandarina]|uniref:Ecdysteroid-regulated 16 kDa protein n=2 Tax=Bombyx TaxID=7090 RepID=Q2F605_BOMMO|nr:ecdysteroid-regulated 16 kDa protein precursor [Bombyx mori]XP_028037162.1 ecdysteroid-regulated 16 kDa protein-like [Bombyx mandarina]ABD36212.1 ecdysteroid-regulated 16 kDa protein precursor [Bombyx mori]AWL83212.1 ML-2 [Bombyx mori]